MKADKGALKARCELARQRIEGGGQSVDTVCSELFNMGYALEEQGLREAADTVYQQTIDLLEDLKAQPGSSLTDSSIARLALSHGKFLLKFNKPRAAIAAFRRSLEVIESSLGCGTNAVLLERQAIILGWLAIAQRRAQLHEAAIESYERAIGLWRKLPRMISAPLSPYGGFLGACLLGAAKVYALQGREDEAESCKSEAEELIEKEFEQMGGRMH